jgi:hypothetical protein
MVIDMNDAQLKSLDQIREFLAGTAAVAFSPTFATGRDQVG